MLDHHLLLQSQVWKCSACTLIKCFPGHSKIFKPVLVSESVAWPLPRVIPANGAFRQFIVIRVGGGGGDVSHHMRSTSIFQSLHLCSSFDTKMIDHPPTVDWDLIMIYYRPTQLIGHYSNDLSSTCMVDSSTCSWSKSPVHIRAHFIGPKLLTLWTQPCISSGFSCFSGVIQVVRTWPSLQLLGPGLCTLLSLWTVHGIFMLLCEIFMLQCGTVYGILHFSVTITVYGILQICVWTMHRSLQLCVN